MNFKINKYILIVLILAKECEEGFHCILENPQIPDLGGNVLKISI